MKSQFGNQNVICNYLAICSFIEQASHSTPFTEKMTRIKFCELSQLGCARHNAYSVLGADMVPDDMWPNEEIKTLEAMEIKIKETHRLLQKSG